MRTFLKILFALFCVGLIVVAAIGIHNQNAKAAKLTDQMQFDAFEHRFTDAGFDMAYKLRNAEQDSTVQAYLSDQAAKEYLLETNQVFIDLCDYTREKNLKEKEPDKFAQAVQMLSFAFNNQAKVIKGMNDPLLMNRAINILKLELQLLDDLGQGMESDILQICNELQL